MSVSKGLKKASAAFPFAVILPVGITAAVVAELFDWQHRSFVLVTLVRGAAGGIKSDV